MDILVYGFIAFCIYTFIKAAIKEHKRPYNHSTFLEYTRANAAIRNYYNSQDEYYGSNGPSQACKGAMLRCSQEYSRLRGGGKPNYDNVHKGPIKDADGKALFGGELMEYEKNQLSVK